MMSLVKRKLFVPALFLMLLAVTFTFDGQGARWFWADQPQVALLLGAASLAMWLPMLFSRKRPESKQ